MKEKVIPIQPPQKWHRTIDGVKCEIIGRPAFVDKCGTTVLLSGASYWQDGRMTQLFRNHQLNFFADRWEKET